LRPNRHRLVRARRRYRERKRETGRHVVPQQEERVPRLATIDNIDIINSNRTTGKYLELVSRAGAPPSHQPSLIQLHTDAPATATQPTLSTGCGPDVSAHTRGCI
jgi:hypothetical protein